MPVLWVFFSFVISKLQVENKKELIIIIKSELIELIWSKNNNAYTKKDIEYIVNCFIKEIQNGVKAGKKVKIGGLGTFSLYLRKAYIGAISNSKEDVVIPNVKYVKFRPSKHLKQ